MKNISFILILSLIVGCSDQSTINITKFEGSPEFSNSILSLSQTAEDKNSELFDKKHLSVGIESLQQIINHEDTVRHLKF